MAAQAVSQPRSVSSKTESYVDNKRKDDISQANILAARAIADAVRTSLGPKGMEKMIYTASGVVVISNDDATILNKMEVLQPAAKMEVLLLLNITAFHPEKKASRRRSAATHQFPLTGFCGVD